MVLRMIQKDELVSISTFPSVQELKVLTSILVSFEIAAEILEMIKGRVMYR